MAWRTERKWRSKMMRQIAIIIICSVLLSSVLVSAQETKYGDSGEIGRNHVVKMSRNSAQSESRSGYKHVWPLLGKVSQYVLKDHGASYEMRFGWKIAMGGIIGFLGAAFGSVGGVGGGGIFVPMRTLIIGFDEKFSTAISKCMVMGGAAATVVYNLGQNHPTLDLPIIDYDLALFFTPMLILGISLGVAFNVIFADWMIILLLIIVFLTTSTMSFLKGVKIWKKETIMKKEAALRLQENANINEEVKYNTDSNEVETKEPEKRKRARTSKNIYWKELGLLIGVWVVVLAIQIGKSHTKTCSPLYWALNALQIPVMAAMTLYEAVSLYKGRRRVASRGEEVVTLWSVGRLVMCCVLGIVAGMLGGLLGLGGGFILGPLYLQLGIVPQVSSATATLIMLFSSSMSVLEYYQLKRFPVPYALYFAGVAVFSAVVGQYVVGKAIKILGRASLIIFILSSMIFISALTLGGVGIASTVEKIHRRAYMGFEDICKY